MSANKDKLPISIYVLNIDGCMESAVLGIADIFNLLNRFTGCDYFKVKIIQPQKISQISDADYLIIPPIIDAPFTMRPAIISLLKKVNLSKTKICSVCSGSFQIAFSGLVGSRKLTTHWGYRKEFKELFPSIKLDINEMITEDRSIITAAGIMAYIDLCLYIIKQSLSPTMAQKCAKIILFNGQRTKQSPYMDNSLIKSKNDQENELIDLIETNLAKELTIKTMSKLLGMHERTFLRWFKTQFKTTPLKFINDARMDRAKSFLQKSKLTVDEICHEVGYLDTSSFRRNFRKSTGLTPTEFRNSV
ncbi:helix-turn-helix domain-containing protein [Bacteriovorax sp. PP10]|uniref:Helix-turn-helix domain-containing protein n=1 Tax=Bacteriovorax antarcticus TaxID=3088717 RepID=A0ABU5VSD8_9BACT|nr:helix-turn-helix domain-containing protein [Bacteriovorax sp. PP10]MEA9355971.1 helix-turn-helix domain-containing protein [Bacteriovorax sp. PP10]